MAIYNEEVNEIYPVQTFVREAMLKQMNSPDNKGEKKEPGGQKTAQFKVQALRSEARLNAFRQYFAKYNRRAASMQFSNEQLMRDKQHLHVKDALLEDIRLSNEDISELFEESLEDDDNEEYYHVMKSLIPNRIKQWMLENKTEQSLQNRQTHDIVAQAYIVRPGAIEHDREDIIFTNKSFINERKYHLVTATEMVMKPTFITNQMSENDYHQSLFQAQIDYLILKMDNPDYQKPKSLEQFSDDPSVSWVQQLNFSAQDETSLQEILIGVNTLESSAREATSRSMLGLQEQFSSVLGQSVSPGAPPLEIIQPSAPPLETSKSNQQSLLTSLSMFQSGDNQMSHGHRPTLSL